MNCHPAPPVFSPQPRSGTHPFQWTTSCLSQRNSLPRTSLASFLRPPPLPSPPPPPPSHPVYLFSHHAPKRQTSPLPLFFCGAMITSPHLLRVWPALTKKGTPCKTCEEEVEGVLCHHHHHHDGHAHLAMAAPAAPRFWPALTKQKAPCQNCKMAGEGVFCRHHRQEGDPIPPKGCKAPPAGYAEPFPAHPCARLDLHTRLDARHVGRGEPGKCKQRFILLSASHGPRSFHAHY